MKARHVSALLGALLAQFCSCTRDSGELTGPTTEEGNPQILAVVVDSARAPVARVVVAAFLMPNSADSGLAGEIPLGGRKVAVSRTDANGRCRFANLLPGFYALEGRDSGTASSALARDISVSLSGTTAAADTLVLASPGSIRGVATRGGVLGVVTNQNLRDGFIQVKLRELDRFTVTGPDGKYGFDDLPPGSYTVLCYATDGFYSAAKPGVHVTSATTTVVDTVTLKPVPRLLPPKGLSARYDAAASVVSLTWRRSDYPGLRGYEVGRIDVAGSRDTVLATTDTAIVDSVGRFAAGAALDYVVASVDSAYNRSQNAGPLRITVGPQ